MFINKLLAKTRLSYADSQEEKEYTEVKQPILRSFVQIVFVVLVGILVPYAVRYFIKDIAPQKYIVPSLIVVGLIIFLCRSKFEGCLDWLLLGFIIVSVVLFSSVAQQLITIREGREYFYMGYALAMVHRFIGYGVIRFRFTIVLYICSFVIKFPMVPNPDPVLNVIIVLMDLLTVALSFNSEKLERKMFDSLYKAKKDVLKFKQLITQYLPNQLAIITGEDANACYLNNAFKRGLKCSNASQFHGVMERLRIEKETLEKNTKLFDNVGRTIESKEESPMSLSEFLVQLSKNRDLLKETNYINFPVIEDLPNQADLLMENVAGSSPHKLTVQPEKNESLSFRKKELEVKKEKTVELNESIKSSDRGMSKESSNGGVVYEEGRKRVFKVKIFSLLWDEKEAIAVVLDDITQQRIIMELKIADKNKDLVIATVSHELRTPLNGMLGLLDIAKKNITQPDTLAYLGACRNSGVLLLNLVNSILDINQIDYKKLRLVFTKFSLRDLFDEIKSLFAYNCKLKMLYLQTEISPEVPDMIKLDKGRLSQILINLLGNAFKFTFQGGVTLKVDLESRSPLKLKFSVVDTGIGISKEDKEKLFKMYGRLEQQNKKINTQGVGLGLTISDTLAKLLNPSDKFGIQVESEVNQGTCFSFIVEPNIGENLQGDEEETASLENLSSHGLNEDRDTILNKVAAHTINNNENYTKMTSSTHIEYGNFDSKRFKDSHEVLPIHHDQELLAGRLRSQGEEKRFQRLEIHKVTPHRRMIDEEEDEDFVMDELKIEQSPLNKKPWCLVVDDNPFNLMVACHIMEDKGFRVKTALNGQEAINKVIDHQKGGDSFVLILMDCQMPVMDGYQATRLLREMMKAGTLRDCPIIALTANNRDDEHEKLYEEVGMNGFVGKPLQMKELDAVLKQVKKRASTRSTLRFS